MNEQVGPGQQVILTREQIEELIESTVTKTLMGFGIDTSDPIELQRDFQSLREWRSAMKEVRRKTLITIAGILVSGLVAAVWLGIKSIWIHK